MAEAERPKLILSERHIDLNENTKMMHRLGLPGGHRSILDYSLLRPIISIPNISDRLSDEQIKSLLLKQYKRLMLVCKKLAIVPSIVNNNYNLNDLQNACSEMMKNLHLGSLNHESSLLVNQTLIDTILELPNAIDFIDYLSQQNSLLGETNAIAMAIMGMSLNIQPMFSIESAMQAMFYVIDYLTKDTLEPKKLLAFVKAARDRFVNFPGHAPSEEDPLAGDRPVRRLGQILQNGITGSVEYGVQQCALNVLGLPSHDSNYTFRYVLSKQAIQSVRQLFNLNPTQEPVADLSTNATNTINSFYNDDELENQYEPEPFVHSIYDEMDAALEAEGEQGNELGTVQMSMNGTPVVTSQYLQYLHRGEKLCFLSLTEYACIIKRIDKPIDEDSNTRTGYKALLKYFYSFINYINLTLKVLLVE
jgi:hypothetical protein